MRFGVEAGPGEGEWSVHEDVSGERGEEPLRPASVRRPGLGKVRSHMTLPGMLTVKDPFDLRCCRVWANG